MLNVTVAGSSAVQQSNNSITAGLISNQPNEMMSIEQAMASTSFFSPKVQPTNQNFGKLPNNESFDGYGCHFYAYSFPSRELPFLSLKEASPGNDD